MSDNQMNTMALNKFFKKNYDTLSRRKDYLSSRLNSSEKVLSFDVTERRAIVYAMSVLDNARIFIENTNNPIEQRELVFRLLVNSNAADEMYENIRKKLEAKNSAE
jgi:hypothetical protein